MRINPTVKQMFEVNVDFEKKSGCDFFFLAIRKVAFSTFLLRLNVSRYKPVMLESEMLSTFYHLHNELKFSNCELYKGHALLNIFKMLNSF